MAKKKHKKKVETASFVEIEKDFGLWEDYKLSDHNMIPSMIVRLFPVKRNVYRNFHSRN